MNTKNKYLSLVPTYKSKEKIKKHEELWNKIRDLIKFNLKSNLIQMTSYL